MSNIFRISESGEAERVKPRVAQVEGADLHELIKRNLDLLPGELISPDDPCRWMLIASEMPVPSPESGSNKWSLDLLLADQAGVPTLVECKLARNPEVHREVLGQLLEYAANGRYYWTAESLLSAATKGTGGELRAALSVVGPAFADAPLDYFDLVISNLRKGRMRLVFVVDKAPRRLQSTVAFLSEQFETTQVLLIELAHFDAGLQRLIVPRIFGPSDFELAVRKADEISSRPPPRQWDEASFLENVRGLQPPEVCHAVTHLLKNLRELGAKLTWGKGAHHATVNFAFTEQSPRNILMVEDSGLLYLNFGELTKAGLRSSALWAALENFAGEDARIELPTTLDRSSPTLPPNAWAPQVDKLINRLRVAVEATSPE